jgi:ribosomal protein L5
MTLTEIKDQGRGGHVWSFEGDYNFGIHDEEIFREVDKDGVYHSSNTGLVLNSYIIFDLDNPSVKRSLEDNKGWFVQVLNSYIREHKINSVLGEV